MDTQLVQNPCVPPMNGQYVTDTQNTTTPDQHVTLDRVTVCNSDLSWHLSTSVYVFCVCRLCSDVPVHKRRVGGIFESTCPHHCASFAEFPTLTDDDLDWLQSAVVSPH